MRYIIVPAASWSTPRSPPNWTCCKPSKERHPGDFQVIYMNQLCWLLSKQRNSSSTTSFPWISELFTVYDPCVCYIIPSVLHMILTLLMTPTFCFTLGCRMLPLCAQGHITYWLWVSCIEFVEWKNINTHILMYSLSPQDKFYCCLLPLNNCFSFTLNR